LCGLPWGDQNKRVYETPDVDWEYEGLLGYPTSPTLGPASADGLVRTCFAHSPLGAVMMASNAMVQLNGSEAAAKELMDKRLAPGGARAEIIDSLGSWTDRPESFRMELTGFRVLDYDTTTALVAVSVRASAQGESGLFSATFRLVWLQGDWWFDSSNADFGSLAELVSVAGYLMWKK
jgi:hypothetical protein